MKHSLKIALLLGLILIHCTYLSNIANNLESYLSCVVFTFVMIINMPFGMKYLNSNKDKYIITIALIFILSAVVGFSRGFSFKDVARDFTILIAIGASYVICKNYIKRIDDIDTLDKIFVLVSLFTLPVYFWFSLRGGLTGEFQSMSIGVLI